VEVEAVQLLASGQQTLQDVGLKPKIDERDRGISRRNVARSLMMKQSGVWLLLT
jgi:hypothetical protein